MSKIVIVGAGASGIVCSIFARRNNNEIIVLEKEDKPLKKVLRTGNGKCNYYNHDMSLDNYHSTSSLLKDYIKEEDIKKIIPFFKSIGIIPKVEDGYYYPSSKQATSVFSALLKEANNLGVVIKTNEEVLDIKKEKDRFIVTTNSSKIICDKVVLSTGSYASVKESTNGYNLAKSFNHNIIKVLPALVSLISEGSFLKEWSGARSDVVMKLYEEGKFIKEQKGQAQFTDYGISGICTFNLSSLVARGLEQNKKEYLVIDFLPDIEIKSISDMIDYLEKRNKMLKNRNVFELLEGIMNSRIIKAILKRTNININYSFNNLSKEQKYELAKNIKWFHLDIIKTSSFNKAQVCSGGVSLNDINPNDFSSNKIDNLYIIGEMLDVDGICGGYNLSFAFLSGMKCGGSL